MFKCLSYFPENNHGYPQQSFQNVSTPFKSLKPKMVEVNRGGLHPNLYWYWEKASLFKVISNQLTDQPPFQHCGLIIVKSHLSLLSLGLKTLSKLDKRDTISVSRREELKTTSTTGAAFFFLGRRVVAPG